MQIPLGNGSSLVPTSKTPTLMHWPMFCARDRADADTAKVRVPDDPRPLHLPRLALGSGTRLREACGIDCGD